LPAAATALTISALKKFSKPVTWFTKLPALKNFFALICFRSLRCLRDVFWANVVRQLSHLVSKFVVGSGFSRE